MEGDENSGKILVIDDEPTLVLAYETVMTTCGYSVDSAQNGRLGFEKIKQENAANPYDAVILDLRMPDLDGLGVMELLHNENLKIPTTLCSGHIDTGIAVKAAFYGVVDYLSKPFSPSELRTAATEMIEDERRFTKQYDVGQEASEVVRYAKWHLRHSRIEDARELLNRDDLTGEDDSLATWRIICDHLRAVTKNGIESPEFASDNFYSAADLLRKIAINRK